MANDHILIGPITELLTMDGLNLKGPLKDEDLPVMRQAGILFKGGHIQRIGPYKALEEEALATDTEIWNPGRNTVGVPGFIDAHTHSCFAGSRAADYALRNSGKTYLEIAAAGGGIWDTVTRTREASERALTESLVDRCMHFAQRGITTLEVKSGYGLSTGEELKMLRAIRTAGNQVPQDLIPTCLAAHTLPRDFQAGKTAYLEMLAEELLPEILNEGLAKRVDAFVEESAFTPEEITPYLQRASEMGFDLTVHADQFTPGGSAVAITCGALSADHLEASGSEEILALAQSDTIAMALPGASLGLGCAFTPARKLLDHGAALAIASDFNPGSAPMGDLLTQAAILGAFEKLSHAEVFAGITFRAAAALGLQDRESLVVGNLADLVLFPADNYNEILYRQGQLQPVSVWKRGNLIPASNT